MNRILQACALLFVAFFVVCVVIANQAKQIFLRSPEAQAQTELVEVVEGQSFIEVAEMLKDKDLINSAFWFRVAGEALGVTSAIKPGEHEVVRGMSYVSLFDVLTDAKSNEVTITIPEGYTLKQIGELVTKNFEITKEEWEREVGVNANLEVHAFVKAAEKPDSVDLEGYLFPDTYRFFASESAQGIVRKLLDAMESKVTSLGEPTGDAAGMTTHEILTLASIVEREVRNPDEMAMVADIFLKRLEIGMALQADSTVNYVTGGDDPSISLTDTELDSPYNTYKYPGLPPGPISNPGLNALTAVMHPAENEYLYFLTDEEGNVYYAKTFEEHLSNKARYMR